MKKRNLLMTTMATLSASGALFAASSTAMAATTHEIAQNDTLWSLSQKYGVSVKALKKVNKLSSDLIIAGQTLKVPSKAEAKLATATTHKVVKGDTLWSIAKKYGVTVASLKKANNLTSDAIDVGQKLRLYASAANTANTVTASADTANASSTSTSTTANSASGASSSTANNSTSPTNAAGNDNNTSKPRERITTPTSQRLPQQLIQPPVVPAAAAQLALPARQPSVKRQAALQVLPQPAPVQAQSLRTR